MEDTLKKIKEEFENAIINGGSPGKTALIRSQKLINILHEKIKNTLVEHGIYAECIKPPIGRSSPEMKIAGELKMKNQDICVVPKGIMEVPVLVEWGPMKHLNITDRYGKEYSEKTLIINVRSQLSSLEKNWDTLFERTVAEALNLHMRYPDAVLGEVFLIPAYSYDDELIKEKKIGFLNRTKIEKYISIFDSINGREMNGKDYQYERCALIIADFSKNPPKVYKNNDELKRDKLVSEDFSVEYSSISFEKFVEDLIEIYAGRPGFDRESIQDSSRDSIFKEYREGVNKIKE